jgi:hypothetical protein
MAPFYGLLRKRQSARRQVLIILTGLLLAVFMSMADFKLFYPASDNRAAMNAGNAAMRVQFIGAAEAAEAREEEDQTNTRFNLILSATA